MKLTQIKLFILFMGLGFFAKADIIQDGVFNGYKVGWFPSVNQSCLTVCAKVSAKPEYEVFSVPGIGNKYTFNCKADTEIGTPSAGKGQLYGNNFSASNYAPFCMVSTPAGQVIRQSKFHCLCAY